MQMLQFHIQGTSPLITHNGRLANPLDPLVKRVKEVTSKKKKTEEDQLAIFRLEWEGGLYLDNDTPCVPGGNIEATIQNAAKLQRRGRDVSRGLLVVERMVPIEYEGPRNIDKMYDSGKFTDVRSVVISGKRTMRCRPIFNEWSLSFTVQFDPEVFNPADVKNFVRDGGRWIGLCEMRPRYGKFAIVGDDGDDED